MTAGRNNAESVSTHWCTPPKYVEAVREFFGGEISLDPCSNEYSIVRASVEYRLPHSDGLAEPWDAPTVFVNPPYGRDKERGTGIGDWLRKCSEARSQFRSEVLALVPVAPNTRHWKDFVFRSADGVAFLYDTRLRFLENGQNVGKGAPMSCAMIYWGTRYERFETMFMRFGAVVNLQHLHGKTIGRHKPLPLFEASELPDSKKPKKSTAVPAHHAPFGGLLSQSGSG